jgi:hypothetical protein
MSKHQSEFAENEVKIALDLFSEVRSPEKNTLGWISSSSPERASWLRAMEAVPGYRLMRELRSYWRVRLLSAAKRENSPEAYRYLLEGWLITLGVEAPEGVLVPARPPRGAPRKQSTEDIYKTFLAQGGQPDWAHLAFVVFGPAYTAEDTAGRTKLRNRCRRAVERRKEQLATKL